MSFAQVEGFGVAYLCFLRVSGHVDTIKEERMMRMVGDLKR